MNLSQLYYFRKLAECQHYTHAAGELFVSQSTLSHAIAALEEDLGCRLFRKDGRNVRLTEEGRFFKGYVDESLGVLDEGIAALKERQGKLAGTVTLGAIDTVRSSYLPAAMMRFRKEHGPLVSFRIFQGSTRDLVQGLRAHRFDLAIAAAVDDADISCEHLYHQDLVAAVSKRHVFAAKPSLSLDDLKGHQVITYRPGTPIGDAVDRFLRSSGPVFDQLNLTRNYEDEVMLGALVEKEPVVGLVLNTSGLAPYSDIAIIPLEEPAAKMMFDVSLLRLSGAHVGPVAQSFADFLIASCGTGSSPKVL